MNNASSSKASLVFGFAALLASTSGCGGGGGASTPSGAFAPGFAPATVGVPGSFVHGSHNLVGLEQAQDLVVVDGGAVRVTSGAWLVFGADGQVNRMYDASSFDDDGGSLLGSGISFAPVEGGLLARLGGDKLACFQVDRSIQELRIIPDAYEPFDNAVLKRDFAGNVYLSTAAGVRRIAASGQAAWRFVGDGDYCSVYPGNSGLLVNVRSFSDSDLPPYATSLAALRPNGTVAWQRTFTGAQRLGIAWFDTEVDPFLPIGAGMHIGNHGMEFEGRYGLFLLKADGSLSTFNAQLGADLLRPSPTIDLAGRPVGGGLDMFADVEAGRFGYMLHANAAGTQLRVTAIMFAGETEVWLGDRHVDVATGDHLASARTSGGIHVLRMSKDGSLRWAKVVRRDGESPTGIVRVAGLPSGGAVMVFREWNGETDSAWYAASIDADGSVSWQRRLPPAGLDGIEWAGAIPLSDGGVCFQFLPKFGEGKRQMILLSCGPNGELRWAGSSSASSVYAAVDGGLSFADQDFGASSIYVWSVDKYGMGDVGCRLQLFEPSPTAVFLESSSASTTSAALAATPSPFEASDAPIGEFSADAQLLDGGTWAPQAVATSPLCED